MGNFQQWHLLWIQAILKRRALHVEANEIDRHIGRNCVAYEYRTTTSQGVAALPHFDTSGASWITLKTYTATQISFPRISKLHKSTVSSNEYWCVWCQTLGNCHRNQVETSTNILLVTDFSLEETNIFGIIIHISAWHEGEVTYQTRIYVTCWDDCNLRTRNRFLEGNPWHA